MLRYFNLQSAIEISKCVAINYKQKSGTHTVYFNISIHMAYSINPSLTIRTCIITIFCRTLAHVLLQAVIFVERCCLNNFLGEKMIY